MKPEIDDKDEKILSVIDQHADRGIRLYEINRETSNSIPLATLRARILRLERLQKIDVYREPNVNLLRCYPQGKMPRRA
jgi:DNA-binding Lrp family transcriptional regulator